MNIVQLYIFIVLVFSFSCNSKETKSIVGLKDSAVVDNQVQKIDSVVRISPPNSTEDSSSNTDSIIGILYVKNKTGTNLKESDKFDSKVISHLGFGAKLFMIDSKDRINQAYKTDSSWIKVKFNNGKCGEVNGYVRNSEIIDSSEADFSVIPTDFDFRSHPKHLPTENQGKLKFKFTKISLVEFNKYKSAYDKQIITDSTKIFPEEKYFTLRIANRLAKFHYGNMCEDWQNFKGYIKPLNSYAIEGCTMEYCYTYLINKTSGGLVYLDDGPFVQGNNLPHTSIKGSKFITFTNGTPSADNGTFMTLFKSDSISGDFNFKEYDSFFTEEWEIEELVWVDEETIAFKGLGNTGYLKGRIMK